MKLDLQDFLSNQMGRLVEAVHLAFFPGEGKKRGKCAISKKVLQISTRSRSWTVASSVQGLSLVFETSLWLVELAFAARNLAKVAQQNSLLYCWSS